ncbi:transcriptional regulator [Halobacteriales archaeon QS_8_69_73]|nr:MAG: transcriptional regulator [Halobacteriales archaeon QS_8_69_73]
MSDEPTDAEPTHDEFTPDPDEVEYPSTLRITSKPSEDHKESALDRAERWEQGDEVPHVVNFEDRARLRQLLTDRRMELLETVMEQPPGSIRALAGCLGRDVHDVHDDVHLLAEYDVIHFEEDGRAKKPYVPYDTVRIEVEFGLPRDESSESAAST